MKISILATFPDPNKPNNPKAGYRRITELIKILKNSGNEIDLLLSSEPWEYSMPECNSIKYIYHKNILVRWIKILFAIIKASNQANVIIIYNPSIYIFPAIIAKYLKCPIIMDYVDLQGTEIIKKRLVRYISRLVEKIFIKNINAHLTISKYLEDKIKTINPRAKILLYRGTYDNARYIKGECINKFNIRDNCVKIFYSGGMWKFNGVDILISAFAKIKDRDIELYIVGFGPEKNSLIDIARNRSINNIAIYEYMTDEELYQFMGLMDILVIPYRINMRNKANFPTKFIEYMSAGKPILATMMPDVSEIINESKCGIVVLDNEESISDGMEELISDPNMRKIMGDAAKAYYEKEFSPEIAAFKVNSFIKKVVNKKYV